MFDILCFTSRALCPDRAAFLCQIERLAAQRPAAIILREKDLTPTAYEALAREVLAICRRYGTSCTLHHFARVARNLGCDRLHMPLAELERMSEEERRHFSVLGASCHSADEARRAAALGCRYITAGHIFETDCKRGLPGRGLSFLREVCQAVTLPVYAIGGIGPETVAAVKEAGAAGACVMSGAMRCADPAAYFEQLLTNVSQ